MNVVDSAFGVRVSSSSLIIKAMVSHLVTDHGVTTMLAWSADALGGDRRR
jgi:hypothetical protein